VDAYKGDLKYVYEVGYGISLGIYNPIVPDTASGAFKFGCAVASSASDRRATGVSVAFIATVSAAEAGNAGSKAAALAPAAVVDAVKQANEALVDGGTVTAGAVALPTLSDIGTIEQPATTSAPTAARAVSSAGFGVMLMVAIAGGACVVAIVTGILLWYCCTRSAPVVAHAPQEDVEDKPGPSAPAIGVQMEPASRL